MSCTVNHLLIERGVKLRKLGHFIMEGRDNMDETTPDDIQERARAAKTMVEVAAENLRLRAVNAKLLEALVNLLFAPTTAAQDAAREAIEEPNK